MLQNIFLFVFGWFLVSVIVALFVGPILAGNKSTDQKPDDEPSIKSQPPEDTSAENRQIAELNGWLQRLQQA